MGLFGGGNSKRTTINEDNRTINDYSGSMFDQSVDSSIDGDYNNNQGEINVTDGGAFDLVSRANDAAYLTSENAMQYGFELANSGFDFATGAIDTNAELVSEYGNISTSMLDRSLSSSENVFNNTAMLMDGQSERNLSAALAVHDVGLQQLSMGSELAFALAEQTNETGLYQQEQNNNALENGFKSMMQFADNVSRSDGSQLAKSTNQTVMFVAGAAVIGLFIMKKWS